VKLGLNLLPFELETNKEAILKIMEVHSQSLRVIEFSKNKISNAFMDYICEKLEYAGTVID